MRRIECRKEKQNTDAIACPLQHLEDKLRVANEELTSAQATIAKLKADLKESNDEMDVLSEESEKELTQVKTQTAAQVKALEREKANLAQEKTSLEKLVEELEASLEEQRKMVTSSLLESKSVSSNVSSLQASLKEAKEELAKVTEERDALEAKVDQLTSSLKASDAVQKKLKVDLEAQVHGSEEERESLSSTIAYNKSGGEKKLTSFNAVNATANSKSSCPNCTRRVPTTRARLANLRLSSRV